MWIVQSLFTTNYFDRVPVVTFRVSDFADQIIKYGEIILFETQGQAGLKPWISHKQIAKQ